MAVISTLYETGTVHPSRAMLNTPYVVEQYIDFAKALTAKGSALAADDIIQCMIIPTGTVLLNAGLQKMTESDSTTLTLHLGITDAGGLGAEDIDEWAVSFDFEAAAVGAYSPQLASAPTWFLTTAADTIDMELATLTGTLTSGKVRVWAILADVSAKSDKAPSIAQPKS